MAAESRTERGRTERNQDGKQRSLTILAKLDLRESPDDNRRVQAVIYRLDANG
jgi:hypothetical protein